MSTDTATKQDYKVADITLAEFGRKEISIALVADVQVGDYVIVHVGHAIGTIDPEEAERTLAMFAEMAQLNEDVVVETIK